MGNAGRSYNGSLNGPAARIGLGGLRSFAVFAPLLRHRFGAIATVLLAVLHLSAKETGLGGLPCAMRELSGLPCPGCGLGTGLLHLVSGEWRAALALHAFTPLFGGALLLLALVAVLPAGSRLRLINRIVVWEERTAFGAVFLATLIGYWLLRLA